jgi:hypothetical protein
MTRPYWLPKLHAIKDVRGSSVRHWVTARDYQIYTSLQANAAVLSFRDIESVAAAYAGDITRMSVAAFESLDGITPSPRLPKSTAWLLIRAYYAAFFAAHCVLRVFGRSCSQLDGNAVSSIHEVADLFEERNAMSLSRGLYRCHVHSESNELHLTRLPGADGGSHSALWAELSSLLSYLSERILLETTTRPGQLVSAKLIEIRTVLLGVSQNTGWLSTIRNRINYQHEYGTWFPYQNRSPYYDGLFDILEGWKKDPMQLQFWPSNGRELQRFMEATVVVLSFCRVIVEDMSSRAPGGQTFHRYGFNALIDRLNQPR